MAPKTTIVLDIVRRGENVCYSGKEIGLAVRDIPQRKDGLDPALIVIAACTPCLDSHEAGWWLARRCA